MILQYTTIKPICSDNKSYLNPLTLLFVCRVNQFLVYLFSFVLKYCAIAVDQSIRTGVDYSACTVLSFEKWIYMIQCEFNNDYNNN